MKKILFFLVLPLFFLLLTYKTLLAVSLSECEKNPSVNINDCINLLSGKVSELTNQKKTLASQISQFDTQIKITQLKITDAQNTLTKLEKEIGILGFRIGYVTDSIEKLEKQVKQRIVATYQQSFISNLELVVASNDFSDLLLKLQYLKQVQENDKKILSSLQQTKANYANQKDEREAKQAAIEEQKTKLETLKNDLDQQKLEKKVLLDVTKNDEVKYQKLLAEAQAEQAVVFGGGKTVFMRNVSQGDSIGSIASYNASKGCSSGAHLHFEVHKNGSILDPNNYLKSATVTYSYPESQYSIYGKVNPSGNLPWPVNDPIWINQGFGVQKNSFIYGPAGHMGIDMQTGPEDAGGDTVKTVKSGKLYGGSYQCGGRYPGTLNYAKVEHDDGLTTWYLHMIPN
mgnify:CR=1 FL=1